MDRIIHDAHCHFFSTRFFDTLIGEAGHAPGPTQVPDLLGWEAPGNDEKLADRWVAELDRHGVARAALIASVPGDERSVATAVARHPHRFAGLFMVNPAAEGAADRVAAAFTSHHLSCACLFPAMHRYSLEDDRVHRVFEAAAKYRKAVFVHCGVLSVGIRKRLGLPSAFDVRRGDPLAVARVAQQFPGVPVVIPHFGAGFLRESLIAADLCPSIHFDTSSSNRWLTYYPGLTLEAVFRQALAVVGPGRLLFGTDSSFFPRGWQRPVYEAQAPLLDGLQLEPAAQDQIFRTNFERIYT